MRAGARAPDRAAESERGRSRPWPPLRPHTRHRHARHARTRSADRREAGDHQPVIGIRLRGSSPGPAGVMKPGMLTAAALIGAAVIVRWRRLPWRMRVVGLSVVVAL